MRPRTVTILTDRSKAKLQPVSTYLSNAYFHAKIRISVSELAQEYSLLLPSHQRFHIGPQEQDAPSRRVLVEEPFLPLLSPMQSSHHLHIISAILASYICASVQWVLLPYGLLQAQMLIFGGSYCCIPKV
jgi:hypothetical protein